MDTAQTLIDGDFQLCGHCIKECVESARIHRIKEAVLRSRQKRKRTHGDVDGVSGVEPQAKAPKA